MARLILHGQLSLHRMTGEVMLQRVHGPVESLGSILRHEFGSKLIPDGEVGFGEVVITVESIRPTGWIVPPRREGARGEREGHGMWTNQQPSMDSGRDDTWRVGDARHSAPDLEGEEPLPKARYGDPDPTRSEV